MDRSPVVEVGILHLLQPLAAGTSRPGALAIGRCHRCRSAGVSAPEATKLHRTWMATHMLGLERNLKRPGWIYD